MTEALTRLGGALVAPLLDPAQRMFLPSLALTALVAAVWLIGTGAGPLRDRTRGLIRRVIAPEAWTHRSSRLDLQLFVVRRLLGVLGAIPAFGGGAALAVAVAGGLGRRLGEGPWHDAPAWVVLPVYTGALFMAWDLSRYVVHRLMHEVPVLWQFHQVHHSAEVLTPMSFYRVHPAESVVYAGRGALVTGVMAGGAFWLWGPGTVQGTILGVNALAFVLTATTGNLRHSHVPVRFGDRLERWLISPAQHQIHHGSLEAEQRSNYGTWLAVWDRLGGTLRLGDALPEAMGLAEADRNHAPDTLWSALVGPVVAGLPRRPVAVAGLALVALLGAAGWVQAQEPGDTDPPPATVSEPSEEEDGAEAPEAEALAEPADPEGSGPEEAEDTTADPAPSSGADEDAGPGDDATDPGVSGPTADPEEGSEEVVPGAEGPSGPEDDDDGSDEATTAPEDPAVPADPAAPEPEPPEAPGPAPEDDPYEVVVDDEGRDLRTAGSAHVVDEEELERFEYDDIHRILGKVPGVYLRDEDGFGLRPNIGIRGANSDRSAKVTLLEDGVLLGPAPYAAPAAYYFPMTTRTTRVEVFKGPAAIQHGPQTVGGAIDMHTREVPDGPLAYVDLGAGNRRTFKVHAFGGSGGERWGALAEVVQLANGGFKQLDDGGPTGFDRTEVMGKAAVRGDPERTTTWQLELKAGYSRERSFETYLGLSDADFAETPYRRYAASQMARMQWQRSQAELRWDLAVGDAFDVEVVAYHHYLTRAWQKLNRFADAPALGTILTNEEAGQAAVYTAILRGEEDTVTPDQVLQIGTNDRYFHSYGVQSVAHHRAATDTFVHQLEVGLRVHADEVNRDQYEDPHDMVDGELVPTEGAERLQVSMNTGRALAIAAYAREDLLVGPVRLTPGARVEAIRTAFFDRVAGTEQSAWRAVVLPGLGVHVQPTEWLGTFAGVYRGFSPVGPGQDPTTRPETSWNTEAGARVNWRGFRAEAVGFFNPYVNLTGQCTFSGGCTPGQIDQQFNGGRVWVWGSEVALGQTFALGRHFALDVDGNYTYTGSSFRTGFVSGFPQFGTVEIGDRLPYVPEHQGTASLTFTHPYGSVAASFTGRSAMRDAASQGEVGPTELVGPMAVLDLAADVRITPLVGAYVTVQNATNAVYQASRRPFGLRPGMPVQVMAGVKVRAGKRDRAEPALVGSGPAPAPEADPETTGPAPEPSERRPSEIP